MLTPGTYRLTKDLPPLKIDRRKTHDWRYLPMSADSLFAYTEWDMGPPGTPVMKRDLRPSGGYDPVDPTNISPYDCRELVAALEPIEDTPSLWLAREHSGLGLARGILDCLVAAGKITLEDVKSAAAAYLESD